jgi:hypothetical protein
VSHIFVFVFFESIEKATLERIDDDEDDDDDDDDNDYHQAEDGPGGTFA